MNSKLVAWLGGALCACSQSGDGHRIEWLIVVLSMGHITPGSVPNPVKDPYILLH